VESFKYLGRIVTVTDSDIPAVLNNLRKARSRWAMVNRVLVRDHASPKVSALFYKAVCQSVLLFSCETWVISKQIIRCLDGFHHRIARRLTGRHIRPRSDGSDGWIRPAIGPALNEAGMYSMMTYISRRREYLISWAQARPNYMADSIRGGGAGGPQRKYWWSANTII
jgi:hypothetical protein